MDDSDCPSEIPAASEDCNTEGCPAFYYSYGAWSLCDVECGGGVQERTVSCVDISGNAADGSCFGDIPVSSQECNTAACPVHAWIYADTEWGECDADCGDGGNQTRDVACVAVTPGDAIEWENVIEIVSDEMCVPEDMLPTRQSCNVGAGCQDNGLCHNNLCSCFHGYETFEDGTCGAGPRIFNIDHIDSAYPWGIPYDEPLTTRWQSAGDVEYVDFMMQLSTENLPKYLATNIRSDTGNQGQFAWDHVSRVQDHTHRMFVFYSDDVQDSTDDWGMSDVCAYLNCEHGYCMDGISAGAVCVCDDNWSGTHCNTDACQELGCYLEGTEVCDSEDGCVCLDGFSGETCSTPDSCTLECANGGHADADCAACNCPRGAFWSSDDCSTCGLTCSNDGEPNDECTACDCQPGWGGEYCDCQHFTISFFVDDVDINMADENEILLFSNLLAHDIAKVIPGWSADQVIIDSVVASGSGVDATVHLRTTCQSVGAAARNLLDATLEQAYADLLEAVSSLYFQERSYIATNIDANTWSAVDEVSGDELAAPELATSYVTEDAAEETGGNIGVIIGAVVGSLVGVALIGVCVWKRDELGECCSRNTGAKKDIHLQNIGSQHMTPSAKPKAPPRNLPPANDPSKWETHLDDESGHYYYYNTVTEVTTWDKPHCL